MEMNNTMVGTVVNNVLITISGQQMISEGGDEGFVELVTPGHMSRVGGNYFITYQESELTGLSGTTTTLSVEGPRVSLSRVGKVSTHMVFEMGRRHLSHYDAVEGALTVGVNANRVRTRLSDTGGEIDLRYQVDIDELPSGENTLSVKIAELKS